MAIEIADVKSYLNITWDDEDTNRALTGEMERAKGIIGQYAGCAFDTLISSGNAKEYIEQLFLDCVRYIHYHSYEDFKVNFAAELTALRIAVQCDAAEAVENE